MKNQLTATSIADSVDAVVETIAIKAVIVF